MNNLTKEMQARLDKFRKKSDPNAVQKPTDYGESLNDFTKKDNANWQRELEHQKAMGMIK